MEEYKIGKYMKKMLISNDIKKKNIYKDKMTHYLSLINQSGGKMHHDNIESNIINIINGKYSIFTDLEIIKNIEKNVENCKTEFFSTSNVGQKFIENFSYRCFERANTLKKIEEENELYKYKKNISLLLTDIFMQKGLVGKDRDIATNYFYYILKYILDIYVDNISRMKYFGDLSDKLYGNIILLYKGGNTTRLILTIFNDIVLEMLKNKKGKTVETTKTILREFNSSYNIGDWDYLVHVEYDKLRDEGFRDDQLIQIRQHIMLLFTYGSNVIKNKIDFLMKNKILTENIAKEIQIKFQERESTDNAFINFYNNNIADETNKKINTFKWDSVYTFDKIINKNEIRTMTNTEVDTIFRNSFIFKNTVLNNKPIGEYFETPHYFVENNIKNFLPGKINKSMVYLAFLNDLSFVRRYAISSFNLFRVKINNVVNFSLTYQDSPNIELKKPINANMEVVDISISNLNDCKGVFNDHYIYPGKKKMLDYTILKPKGGHSDANIEMVSPHTMFADIAHMLFTENLFTWQDPKYSKRIRRLLLVSLPCMFMDKMEIKNIINTFTETRNLFSDMLNKNLLQKLDLLKECETVISPKNDLIRKKINNVTKQDFINLDINHLIVVIKNTSPLKKLRYTEFLIANYCKMLAVTNYIINNNIGIPIGGTTAGNKMTDDLVKYELNIHRIIELPTINNYFNEKTSTLTPGLTSIYQYVRGTNHSLANNDLVPLGPLKNLLPANDTSVENFMKIMGAYESAIVEIVDYIVNILIGMRDGGINIMDIKFKGESLY